MRLSWVVLALVLAAPLAWAAPGCLADQPCTVEVTLDPMGTLGLAQPDIAAGRPLVLLVSNQADGTVNVTLDGTPLRVMANATSNMTSQPLAFSQAGTYVVREDRGNTTATLTISPALPPEAGDGGTNLWAVLLPVMVGLALIALAGVVVRHGDHRHNRLFAALYFLSGLKSLSEGIAPMGDRFNASASLFPDTAAWGLVGSACALLMTPLLLLFVSSFPRPTEWMVKHPRRGVLAFLPSLVIAVVLFTSPTPNVAFGAAIGFSLFSTFVTAAAVVLLWRARAGSPDEVERKQASYVIIGFLPSFIATWVITTLYLLVVYGAVAGTSAQWLLDSVVGIISPVFELLAASLVGFAILKYQLLGINPRFRLGVKSVLAGGMFIVLFILTQFIENVILQGKVFSFAGDYGSFILSGATGIVLFKPIEKVSGRVSDKLLPGAAAVAAAQDAKAEGASTAPVAPAAALHAEQIYHAQCTYVLRDAQVTEREMALLRNLRSQLGLSEQQARRVEEDVERLLKVDAPQTGQVAVGAARAPEGAEAESAAIAAGEVEVRRGANDPPT